MYIRKITLFIISIGISVATIAFASGALETVRGPVAEVVSILQDSRYQTPGQKALQRQELHRVTADIFDFTEISKRALARNWKIFTPEERRAFTQVFTELLENTYTKQIRGNLEDIEVIFLAQETVSATKAVVKSKITRKTGDIPVNYHMITKEAGWRIYDIIIEGVSLIKNYRTQFNDILIKESPSQLIELLSQKVAELKSGDAS